jgi:FtsZ-interacting cell division protein ZipA
MTAVLIIIGVVLLAALAYFVWQRRERDMQVVETRKREVSQHRQEAQANEERGREMLGEAAEKRRVAEQARREAEELEERGERALAHAGRHEDRASEANEEVEQRSKRFRVR